MYRSCMSPGLAEYDVIVDDAPTSANMKDKVWASLMQLFPMLRSVPGIPPQFYINALKYSPAPASFVTETQKIMTDAQQQPPPPAEAAKIAYDQARTADLTAHSAYRIMEGQHMGAETARVGVVAALAPQEAGLKVTEQEAKIESLRAGAAAALAKAGLQADDQKYQQVMGAVDALLRSHGAAMDHVAGVHSRAMDVANFEQQRQQAAQQAQQPQGKAA